MPTIEFVPTGSDEVEQVAVRAEDTATAEHPLSVLPFAVNFTVPVGVGGPVGVTVMVNVTLSPVEDGFALDAKVDFDGPLFTTWDKVALVLVA